MSVRSTARKLLGPSVHGDLVTNGGFEDGGTGWSTAGASTISGGVARIYSPDGALSQISQNYVCVVGKTYLVKYDVLQNNGGGLNNSSGTKIWPSTVGSQVTTYKADNVILVFKRSGITDITIDNVSVEEISVPHCLLSMDANTGYDLSYGGASLTLNGATPQTDGTLLFDAVGQYASVQDVIPVDESYWVEAWIRPETFGENDYGRLFDNGPAVWYLYGAGSLNRISFTASSYNATSKSADGSISVNTWQHVAISVRYDSGDGKMYTTFYINGVQSGTEQDAGTPLAGTTDLFLGNHQAGTRTFDGSMSTPRIFRVEAPDTDTIKWYANQRLPVGATAL